MEHIIYKSTKTVQLCTSMKSIKTPRINYPEAFDFKSYCIEHCTVFEWKKRLSLQPHGWI